MLVGGAGAGEQVAGARGIARVAARDQPTIDSSANPLTILTSLAARLV